MTNFGYILIIIFEVIFAGLLIWGLIWLEKRVQSCIENTDTFLSNLLNKIEILRKNLEEINKKIKTLKKIDFKEVKEISALILDIINFIMLVKSVDFKRGLKLRFTDIKKLIPLNFLRKIFQVR